VSYGGEQIYCSLQWITTTKLLQSGQDICSSSATLRFKARTKMFSDKSMFTDTITDSLSTVDYRLHNIKREVNVVALGV